jgi:hypothetical protein
MQYSGAKPRPAPSKNQKILAVVIFVAVFVTVAAVIYFALGGGHEDKLTFTVEGGSYTVITTYLDGDGIHQSTQDWTGSFSWTVTGASTANVVAMSTDGQPLTGSAYHDGDKVDTQSGISIMISAKS